MANKQLLAIPAPFGTAAGRVTKWTANGADLAGVTAQMLSFNVRQNFPIADLLDGDGNIIGRAGHNETHEMTIEVVLYGGANEAASRLLQNLPDKMSIVTIANNNIGPVVRTPDLIDGDWNYVGGSYEASNGAYHRYVFTLWRGGVGANPDALALVN